MLKTNPKSLHSKLPAIWNWVYDHIKESNTEFAEEFKSPIKNFASPRNSATPKTGGRRTKEERKQDLAIETLKNVTKSQIDLFKTSNKDLMVPAAKVLLCAFILINGPSEEVKNLEAEGYKTTWEFVKPHLTNDFIKSLIQAQPTELAKAYTQKLIQDSDLKGFKPSDIVEPVFDCVKALCQK